MSQKKSTNVTVEAVKRIPEAESKRKIAEDLKRKVADAALAKIVRQKADLDEAKRSAAYNTTPQKPTYKIGDTDVENSLSYKAKLKFQHEADLVMLQSTTRRPNSIVGSVISPIAAASSKKATPYSWMENDPVPFPSIYIYIFVYIRI